jgi:hypothetical protein
MEAPQKALLMENYGKERYPQAAVKKIPETGQ